MSSSKERIQKALDSLLYLPHLKAQNEQANLTSLASPGQQEGGKGRVWDRGDLFRRLSTFKASTWFCKPEPISPVECARRGWLNTGVDMLTCEFCKAKVSCPIPPQLMPDQARVTGERFARQLVEAHQEACPWRSSVCAQSLLQFPPLTSEAVLQDFERRVRRLQRVLCLPPLAAAAVYSSLPSSEQQRLDQLLLQGPEQQQQQQQQQQQEGQQQQQQQGGSSGGEQQPAGAASMLEGGTVTCDAREFLAYARLLALCGWDVRAMSTGNAAPSSGSSHSVQQELQPHMGPESAALHCRLCGVRAGLWSFFPQVKPKVIVTPRMQATTAAATIGAAASARKAGGGLGSAVVVDFSTTIAGGSLKSAARPAGVAAAAPFGAAAAAPVFGAAVAGAAAGGEAAGEAGRGSQAPAETGAVAATAPEASAMPVFGFAALEASFTPLPAKPAGTTAAAAGVKRKQQDFSWETVQAEIEAATAAEKRARNGTAAAAAGTGGAVAAAAPAAATTAATEPAPAPTPALLAKYRSLESTPLDPLSLHRSYCPWVHCSTPQEQQGGGRCGWRWCLQQLAPGTEDGSSAQAAAAAEDGAGGEGSSGRHWDPAGLLRSMLNKVEVHK